jgi:hypothetical protein
MRSHYFRVRFSRGMSAHWHHVCSITIAIRPHTLLPRKPLGSPAKTLRRLPRASERVQEKFTRLYKRGD